MTQSCPTSVPEVTLPADFVLIPAGEFFMGGDDRDASVAEQPVHRVCLDNFGLASCLVTNAEFEAFVSATGYSTTADCSAGNHHSWQTHNSMDRANHPVVYVSWHDATAYCLWKSDVTGLDYRLPSEAEWEKAARGKEGLKYAFGNDVHEDAACWNRWMEQIGTMPIKSFAPNDYGLYDMAGNVWEWCKDWYSVDYYQTSPYQNPMGPASGEFRVRRGASWNIGEPFRMRNANRGAMPPGEFWPNLGFRCALSISR